MEILKSAVILVIGFVLLIKGADYFVEGSSSVAKKFKVPSLIIGMTIVAMGTSLPELAVSVTAAMAGNNTLAVSNVAGSNIFNLMVVCGACALFAPLAIEKNTLMKEFPFSILCAGLLVVMGYLGMSLGRVDGVILLVIFAVYLFWMIQSAKKARTSGDKLEAEEEALAEEEIKILPMWKCMVFIIGGMIAIKFGGDFVVDGASAIADAPSTTKSPPNFIAIIPPIIKTMHFHIGRILISSSASASSSASSLSPDVLAFFADCIIQNRYTAKITSRITPSTRPNDIPRYPITTSRPAQRIENGNSFINVFFSMASGANSAQAPQTTIRLKILDPATLLTASVLFPAMAAVTLTASSGKLVPIATIVIPMIKDGTLNFFATEELPSTK